ncbi:MAG: hypothetical protein M1569_02965 [Candidatus Marsarchaeota archaeon]|nr:hypothetical protein [Candidatus Marsarchaeota archaeon]MCL5413338.1 hypothetical protein [Candidatus Marsarchaeota archaeon]
MDRSEIVYAAAQIPLVTLSFFSWKFIAVSMSIAVAYWYLHIRAEKSEEYGILSFSKSLSRLCAEKGINHALAEALNGQSSPNEIKELSIRTKLGGGDTCQRPSNPLISELYDMLMLGLQRGMDISKDLKMFTANLEADLESKNRIMRNSLNMDVISKVGIAFFVPLFGGIGASIIGASGAILNSDVALMKSSFEMLIVIYVAVMSYVTIRFRPFGRQGNAIIGSIQAAAIGAAIIVMSSSIITYAI